MKIFIDAGHGGHDGGATNENAREATIKLNIASILTDRLIALGAEVKQSRAGDYFLSLGGRAKKANDWGATYFISLHCNSAENRAAQGLETYHFPGSRGGRKLAELVHTRLIEDHPSRRDRKIKTANFAVLRKTNMPAILVEFGFLTNSDERGWLLSQENQTSLANSIALALMGQVTTKPKPKPTTTNC